MKNSTRYAPEQPGRWRQYLMALGAAFYRGQDERANANGWVVDPTMGGLGRVYRDPRIAANRRYIRERRLVVVGSGQ